MPESERMAALKKAYAETILNTAKEAAGRVLVSEKKALLFQRDLARSKDEAVRLLVRLKQMIDAKVVETMITTSSQQSKIDVLESQLQEAEGVVIDLRAELKWARAKLEKVKSNQCQHLDGKFIEEKELSCQNVECESINLIPSDAGHQTVTTSHINITPLDQKNLYPKCCNGKEQMKQLSSCPFKNLTSQNSEFSIIMRDNETELYRNGCTQRIRASEGNLQAGKFQPSGEIDEHNLTKDDESTEKSSRKGDEKSNLSYSQTKDMDVLNIISGEEVRKHVWSGTVQRRKIRLDKTKAKYMSWHSQLRKPYQLPAIFSRCRSYLANGNVKSRECSHTPSSIKTESLEIENSEELQTKLNKDICFMDEEVDVCERKIQRDVQTMDTTSSFLSNSDNLSKTSQSSVNSTHCRTYSFLLHGNVKSGEDQSKITEKVKLKPLPRLDPGLTRLKGGGVDTMYCSKTVTVKGLDRSVTIPNAAEEDVELKQECDAAVDSTVPYDLSNPDMVDVPIVYSNLTYIQASRETIVDAPLMCSDSGNVGVCKDHNVVSPHQVDNNRLIKYTFHRKRKKEALNNPDQSTCFGKIAVDIISGEKQSDFSKGSEGI